MNVFLDDERRMEDCRWIGDPSKWVLARTPEEAYTLVSTGEVERISLDYHLGTRHNGYNVARWINFKIQCKRIPPPIVFIHTADSGAAMMMRNVLKEVPTIIILDQGMDTEDLQSIFVEKGIEIV